MRVYDYKCDQCGVTEEKFVQNHEVKSVPCALCEGTAHRVACAPRFTLDPNDKAGFPSAYAKWDKHHKQKQANKPAPE